MCKLLGLRGEKHGLLSYAHNVYSWKKKGSCLGNIFLNIRILIHDCVLSIGCLSSMFQKMRKEPH